jgi:hypothetical protein
MAFMQNNINKSNKISKKDKNYIMIPNEMTHYSMVSGKTPWCLKPAYVSDEYGD